MSRLVSASLAEAQRAIQMSVEKLPCVARICGPESGGMSKTQRLEEEARRSPCFFLYKVSSAITIGRPPHAKRSLSGAGARGSVLQHSLWEEAQ